MKTDYDLIVAGGGLAGMIAAHSASHYSNQKLSILVIDRNAPIMLGSKSINGWVCGDAVSKEAVDYMGSRIKVSWGAPEIEHRVKGVMALSPDRETSIPFDGDGFLLNRQQLPQTQYKEAQKRGINVDFEINLTGLLYDGNQIIGVEGLNKKTNQPYKKTAKVVIDATGVTSMLRNQIKNTTRMERKIDRTDLESTGRHIMYFDQGEDDLSEFDPDYCLIHLDQDIAPGGYGWVFPKGKNKVNIGLGVEKTLLDKRNKRLGKHDDVSGLINQYVARNKAIKNPRLSTDPSDSHNATGNFQVSVRRQNDCMVANGFMLVGDSAWMPKPLDAGGIGPALIAGTIIGKNVAHAIEAGDVTEKGLWQYNVDYVREYGYKTAGLEVFRRLLQMLTNDQINYGMKHFLGNMDVEAISKGEHPDFSMVGKMGMLIRGALNKKLADGLRYTTQQNRWLTEHYRNYPTTPDGFEEWHKKLLKTMNEAYEHLAKWEN
ncbi:NAD(P)/FAD-dependent oxidoreductase [Candidatus Nitrosotenuis aquarius]|uniref:NAD(P)/FAD-dependent oxidoreductase n=1 Tax=Candidatus Nitrosotenuis aquarius TaxID=1846278 RepID=UPI0030B94DC4